MFLKFLNLINKIYNSFTSFILLNWPNKVSDSAHSKTSRPVCCFSTPGTIFLVNEPIEISTYPYQAKGFCLNIIKHHNGITRKIQSYKKVKTGFKFALSDAGSYSLFIEKKITKNLITKKIKSSVLKFNILEKNSNNIETQSKNRIKTHMLETAFNITTENVRTLHDPWVLPPNLSENSDNKWFPTAAYEGMTSLYNEHKEYYEDPFQYFLDCIRALKDRGVNFISWHDILDNHIDNQAVNIILQFDIDAGPKSFYRLSSKLLEYDIRANIMLHKESTCWYRYDIKDLNIDYLKKLESAGWIIGYHQNSLTNITGYAEHDIYKDENIEKAQEKLCEDVRELRKYFDIRTLTHHGGNIFNYRVPVPGKLNITCVDKRFAPDLWKKIDHSFSDGGFFSRPVCLSDFARNTGVGLHFMRCHPVKYANYGDDLDIPCSQPEKHELPEIEQVYSKLSKEGETLNHLEKQVLWFSQRENRRQGIPLRFGSISKPISKEFKFIPSIEEKICEFRSKRKHNFLRLYPWKDGDPRVFWWRMLAALCPDGIILNVGALPVDQKDEISSFVPESSTLEELDVDTDRHPDIAADFCDPGLRLDKSYDAILIFGLPYFSNPRIAVNNAQKYLNTGHGRLLLGFVASSHPARGGIWRPIDRPVWREGDKANPGEILSLRNRLWSFDKQSVDQLMSTWPGTYKLEYFNHYWFITAEI